MQPTPRSRRATGPRRRSTALRAVRDDLRDVCDDWLELMTDSEALKTVPRGFRRDHPRARFLRHAELVAGSTLPAGPALSTRAALEHTAAAWRAAAPLNAWLDRHVGPSSIPPEIRWRRA